ncbi:DUF202 domain-containing protein [Actinoallomurus sp. NPDC052308]|uniref:DUF202 domain-containing protein n=1 Tax=Actinoallomurus sp. NPDC052308 TaxID=3155530 RepID=UPI003443F79D
MTPASRPDRDSGLATERTRLAWTRTAVAVTALDVAIIKAAPVIGLPVLAVTSVFWVVCRRRGPYGAPWRFKLTTGAIVGVCAAALVAALVGGHVSH